MKMKSRNFIYQLVFWGFFLAITSSCEKDATKKDPVVTWANPADLVYGTLLSATQLNATSDVPGNFVYTPALGVKLEVGANQDLKVDFVPTDIENYNSASKTVKINVIASTTNTVTDIDGNIYNTVTIGTQVWMVENLKTTKYNDGSAIPNITDNTAWAALTTPAYCWYNNDATANKSTYGALYNWHAVNTGKLCPSGWHVPTDADWQKLEIYLGLSPDLADSTERESNPTNEGSRLAGNAGLWSNGLLESNAGFGSIGFNALPGGARSPEDGTFKNINILGVWWTATVISDDKAWCRVLWSHLIFIDRDEDPKGVGMSIRCVKD